MADRVRPPDDITPGEFFTRWIGDAVAGDVDRRSRLGATAATIVFELSGNPGGTWSVRIDGGCVEGTEGPSDPHDLRVRVDIDTWRALNRGAISAPEALLRRKVRIQGDFLLALKLHLILG